MRTKTVFAIFVISSLAAACQDDTRTPAGYLGWNSPGDTPEIFAPGIISVDERFEQFLLFSPEGDELILGLTNADWSEFTLHHMRLEAERWSAPEPAPFAGSEATGLTAAVTADGRRALFTDARPSYLFADIWMSERSNDMWSEPEKLGPPLSSDADEW